MNLKDLFRHLSPEEAAKRAVWKTEFNIEWAVEHKPTQLNDFPKKAFTPKMVKFLAEQPKDCFKFIDKEKIDISVFTPEYIKYLMDHNYYTFFAVLPREKWPEITKTLIRYMSNQPYAYQFWKYFPDDVLINLLTPQDIVKVIEMEAMIEERNTFYPQENKSVIFDYVPKQCFTREMVIQLCEMRYVNHYSGVGESTSHTEYNENERALYLTRYDGELKAVPDTLYDSVLYNVANPPDSYVDTLKIPYTELVRKTVVKDYHDTDEAPTLSVIPRMPSSVMKDEYFTEEYVYHVLNACYNPRSKNYSNSKYHYCLSEYIRCRYWDTNFVWASICIQKLTNHSVFFNIHLRGYDEEILEFFDRKLEFEEWIVEISKLDSAILSPAFYSFVTEVFGENVAKEIKLPSKQLLEKIEKIQKERKKNYVPQTFGELIESIFNL